MFTLPSDMQKLTCDFLGLRNINSLYCLSKCSIEMFEVLTKHTNFTINAKVILTDEQIEWFKSRNIKVNLFKEVKIFKFGTRCWYTNGELDGPDNDSPAIIHNSGSKEYYKKGIRHRLGGPAKIFNSGTEEWYTDGLCHRLNGICQHWYKNGKQHRLEGPATVFENVGEEWYENGLLHRLKGPAIIKSNGDVEFWEYGVRIL